MTSPNDPSPNDIWKSLAEAKWVRIMADFCANGIWHQDGRMAAFDDLPVAESLKERIRHWQERHDRENCDHIDRDDPRWRPWDVAGFAAEGREIARALKAALPDWTVVYVDESRRDRSRDLQSRSEIEYEILLLRSRRASRSSSPDSASTPPPGNATERRARPGTRTRSPTSRSARCASMAARRTPCSGRSAAATTIASPA